MEKYPKSKNNKQCIGPCYKAGTWIVHPITLNYIQNKNDFCPINETFIKNPNTGNEELHYMDVCFNATENKDVNVNVNVNKEIQNNLELDIINPNIVFDPSKFLKLYYNIYSFDNVINWLQDKNYTNIMTKKRIIECGFEVYGEQFNIMNKVITEFYIDIIKKKLINKLHDKLYKYIKIDDHKIMIKENQDNINDFYIEKQNFIISNFINSEEINKFLTKTISQKNANNILSNTDYFINLFAEHLENKIIITIKK